MRRIRRKLQRCFSAYRFVAMTIVNTVVLVLLLNAFLAVVYWCKDLMVSDPVSLKYGYSSLSFVYPDMTQSETELLLRETWTRQYAYEPFRQFRESPFRGKYVNVDSNGFRLSENQGDWPPSPECVNIFLFGGSTAFGYGVSDHQTTASCLQRHLKDKSSRTVCVYNFGQGNYYSTQERIYFEELIAAGFTPDICVFVDGLNDFFCHKNEPALTEQFRDAMQKVGRFRGVADAIEQTSIGRLASGMNRRIQSLQKVPQQQERFENPAVIDSVIERYLVNKKLIETVAAASKSDTAFVWQPVPVYKYDLNLHPFSREGMENHRFAEFGYPKMKVRYETGTLGDNLFWLADLQQHAAEPLYVDQVHYTAKFTNEIARSIGEMLLYRYPQRFAL